MEPKITVPALLATGLTQKKLADLVPCSQAAINAFLHGHRGARPSAFLSNRLEQLHTELCPQSAQ